MAASTGDWIEAGPFRAHLRHLMAVGGLEANEVATLTGLSARAVTHILFGRSGRAQRRISPETARRLLQVSPEAVRSLRWCLTPSDPARSAYDQLRAAGWGEEEVAAEARVTVAELRALAGHPRCSRLLTVRLVSLVRTLPTGLQGEDEVYELADAA